MQYQQYKLTLSKEAQSLHSLFVLAFRNQETGRLGAEKRSDKQKGRWEELHEDRELPLESVGFETSLDGKVDPESDKGPDLDEDVEESYESTTN